MKNSGIFLYNKAKKIIPGGTQLLSKRPEMFLPNEWPSYYSKCKGVNIVDLDGNQYIDMSICGAGACVLGYADEDVNRDVKKAIDNGSMCTLNCPEEVELAELFCNLHPWASMVRYSRCGGEALAMAVRIARSFTNKEKVLFCGYHGWHDWYMSANLLNESYLDNQLFPNLKSKGIPKSLLGTSLPFEYNDLEIFEKRIMENNEEIACVVMEPLRNTWPKKGFLEKIREITFDKNIPLIFDEVTSGFRINNGGIHLKLGINPDMAVFAKAIGNGFPLSVIIGKSDIMDAAQDTFISSTFWTDRIGPVAGLSTIRKFINNNVSFYLIKIGNLVQNGWKDLSKKYDINIKITGISPLSHWEIKEKDSKLLHTLITKLMMEKGFLTSQAFYSSYSHSIENVNNYLESLDKILKQLIDYIKKGNVFELYNGEIAHFGLKYVT